MPKTKYKEPSRQEKDRAMMLSPLRWPRWPWLPIKRYDAKMHMPECASIYADDPHPKTGAVRVWNVNVWRESKPEVIKTYESIDKLLADGWVVD